MPPVVQQQIALFYTGFRPEHFNKGDILVFAGESPDGIYYLSRGTVRQYDISKRGVDLVVNIFVAPALFPMSYALNDLPNEYFFDAATPVTVQRSPPDKFRTFLSEHNGVTGEMLARAHRRLDIMMRRQTLLMGSNAGSRLAYEIALSCHSFGERHKDGTYTVRLSETELAARVGLARETVSRQIHDLKSRGLIQLTNEHINVINLSQLEASLTEGP